MPRSKENPNSQQITSKVFQLIREALVRGESKGGDIKDQIASLRAGLSDSKVSELYGLTLIDPKKGLKSIAKAGKKEGYKFDKKELGAALDEMNDAGAFYDVELDDAALASLIGMGGSMQQANSAGKS